MLLSAASVLVVAQSSSEIPDGLMNNPVSYHIIQETTEITVSTVSWVLYENSDVETV